MREIIIPVILSAFLLALGAGAVGARDDIKVERVSFERGKSSAVIKSSITGYAVVDYVLGARQGQSMKLSMTTDNSASYFNILAPGEDQVALFNGSIYGNQYEGILPESGDYKVRVYMMRSAARRNEVANYTLNASITGSATVAQTMGDAPATDAKVEGTPYHATGQVPCSMGDAPQGSAQCDFGVIRGKPGNAQVHLTPPGGFERVLIFVGEKVSSDADAQVKAEKSGDLWVIEVNDYEHYRIPEAVITGG
ncbi:MAG: hypothetical protein WBW79_07285 [Desulfocapsaceae bacterium]